MVTPVTRDVDALFKPLMTNEAPVIVTVVPPFADPVAGEILNPVGTFGVRAYTAQGVPDVV
jgi:hypothetical protein